MPSRGESAVIGSPARSKLLRWRSAAGEAGRSRRSIVDRVVVEASSGRLDPAVGPESADSRGLGCPGPRRPDSAPLAPDDGPIWSARLVGLEITGFAPFISAANRRGPVRESAAARLRDLPSNLRSSERISFACGRFGQPAWLALRLRASLLSSRRPTGADQFENLPPHGSDTSPRTSGSRRGSRSPTADFTTPSPRRQGPWLSIGDAQAGARRSHHPGASWRGGTGKVLHEQHHEHHHHHDEAAQDDVLGSAVRLPTRPCISPRRP